MKKETYTSRKEEIERRKELLNAKLRELNSAYIDSNTEFAIGEKVLITTPEKTEHWSHSITPESKRYVFICDITIGYKNNIDYSAFKCKKDGTPSMHKHYIWSDEIITKV